MFRCYLGSKHWYYCFSFIWPDSMKPEAHFILLSAVKLLTTMKQLRNKESGSKIIFCVETVHMCVCESGADTVSVTWSRAAVCIPGASVSFFLGRDSGNPPRTRIEAACQRLHALASRVFQTPATQRTNRTASTAEDQVVGGLQGSWVSCGVRDNSHSGCFWGTLCPSGKTYVDLGANWLCCLLLCRFSKFAETFRSYFYKSEQVMMFHTENKCGFSGNEWNFSWLSCAHDGTSSINSNKPELESCKSSTQVYNWDLNCYCWIWHLNPTQYNSCQVDEVTQTDSTIKTLTSLDNFQNQTFTVYNTIYKLLYPLYDPAVICS